MAELPTGSKGESLGFLITLPRWKTEREGSWGGEAEKVSAVKHENMESHCLLQLGSPLNDAN